FLITSLFRVIGICKLQACSFGNHSAQLSEDARAFRARFEWFTQAANICTECMAWAHSQCAECSSRDFLASCRRRVCDCACGRAFALLSSYQFCGSLAGARDKLGRLGRDFLSVVICSL